MAREWQSYCGEGDQALNTAKVGFIDAQPFRRSRVAECKFADIFRATEPLDANVVIGELPDPKAPYIGEVIETASNEGEASHEENILFEKRVRFRGKDLFVKHRKGLRHLRELVAHPHQQIHALVLQGCDDKTAAALGKGRIEIAQSDAEIVELGRKVKKLEQQLSDARCSEDETLYAALRSEKESLEAKTPQTLRAYFQRQGESPRNQAGQAREECRNKGNR